MSSINRYSNYDVIASMYDDKGNRQHDIVVEQLEKLVLQDIPEGAHIFDLGCGTGKVVERLLKKGYQVTGLDGSEGMLHYARENAPGAEFILDDARFFKLPPTFHAVISTDVVLNYVISLEELKSVFHNVYAAMLDNGIFAFEMYLEELCESDWSRPDSAGDVKDDNAWVVRSNYDPDSKVLRNDTTRFQLIKGNWQRSDVTFLLKAYSVADVQLALEKVGFTEVTIYDIERDLGVDEAHGRACFVCRKLLIE